MMLYTTEDAQETIYYNIGTSAESLGRFLMAYARFTKKIQRDFSLFITALRIKTVSSKNMTGRTWPDRSNSIYRYVDTISQHRAPWTTEKYNEIT